MFKKILLLLLSVSFIYSKNVDVINSKRIFPRLITDPNTPANRVFFNSDKNFTLSVGSGLDAIQVGKQYKFAFGLEGQALVLVEADNIKNTKSKNVDLSFSVPFDMEFKNYVFIRTYYQYQNGYNYERNSVGFKILFQKYGLEDRWLLPYVFSFGLDTSLNDINKVIFTFDNMYDFVSIKYLVAPYFGFNFTLKQEFRLIPSFTNQIGITIGKPERNRVKIVIQHFAGKSIHSKYRTRWENHWSLGVIY